MYITNFVKKISAISLVILVSTACSSGSDDSDTTMDAMDAMDAGNMDMNTDGMDTAPTQRLLRNISDLDGTETLTDVETGLVWVNDVRFCMAGITTPEASTCSVLSDMAVGGLTDWRIPNSQEMSEVTLAVNADEDITFNYINASCAVMTASDGWVFTENSNAPGVLSAVQPGNAGVRCVSGESATAVDL